MRQGQDPDIGNEIGHCLYYMQMPESIFTEVAAEKGISRESVRLALNQGVLRYAVSSLVAGTFSEAMPEKLRKIAEVDPAAAEEAKQGLANALEQYAAISIARGDFAQNWRDRVEAVAAIDKLQAFHGSQNILGQFSACASQWEKNTEAFFVAHKLAAETYIQGAVEALKNPAGEFGQSMTAAGLNEDTVERELLEALNQYALAIVTDGTFQASWGNMLKFVAAADSELAAQAASKIFHADSAVRSATSADLAYACRIMQGYSVELTLGGYFAMAADMAAETLCVLQERQQPEDAQRIARKNLDNIVNDWRAVVMDHAGDQRTPEQKQKAQAVFENFLARWFTPAPQVA
jgi:hypothetical protein